jgi:hypothetical protein
MTQETLLPLYKADPKAKAAVKHASGYAVFSDLGVKILTVGSRIKKSSGDAVNNTGENRRPSMSRYVKPGVLRGMLFVIKWRCA